MTFDAFWLPGLSQGDELITRELSDNVAIRYPALTAERVRELCRSVRARAAAARAITVQQRVRAIACATAFLRQPDNDAFEQAVALIAAATGYSIDMTRHVLLRMAQDWTEPALLELIASELGDPIVLEGPVPDGNSRRRVMAVGPQLAAHIFAGNVPGVAVTSLIRTLLLKSGAFGKTALEEPVLPVLFARSLAAVDPALAGAINVTYWPGGTTGLEEALLREADTSIVYGSRDVVSLARTSAPLNARLVIHGPRLSLGLVQGQNLDLDQIDAIAADAAGAVATFDQQGCVSPHAIFVLGPMAAAHDLATGLARALHQLEHRLPRGRMTPGEAVAMLDARARAEFQAIAGRNIVLYSGREAPYTVVLDADEGFEASCLNRFITVRPLAAVERLTELLRPLADVLQSIALAGFTEEETIRLAPVLGGLGISRITSFRALPWPPPAWHHDGSEPLRELIRWIDLEI